MFNPFAGIEGQDQVTGYLASALQTGQVTHAYLIVGTEGSCHVEIARRFAAGLLAAVPGREGDVDTAVYDAALRGAHPDIHFTTPASATGYLVEQVREVVHDVELAPVRAARKVYVIEQADRMKGTAANAFLKTLEEPPADVTVILLAQARAGVLQTLASRCQVLVCNLPRERVCASPELCAMVSDAAQGAGSRTLLAHAAALVERSQAGVEELASRHGEQLAQSADYLSAGARKALETAHKRELAMRQRAALLEQVGMVRSVLRDCLLASQGVAVPAAPEARWWEQLDGACSPARVLSALDATERAQERVAYNVTPQLAIEAMLFELKEALCPR